MTYVILQHCCNDAACVSACPVDCIHPRPDEPSFAGTEMLYIDPDMCINCGSCQVVCPVNAILPDCDVRSDQLVFSELNAAFYQDQAEPATYSLTVPDLRTGVAGPVRELRVAVVGSGPAGCYAAEELLSRRDVSVRVDMFERLMTPWGLVRFGVAPDHLATKNVITGFERMTQDPRFRLWLNVEVGRDISPEQLSERYHAVIYAVGAMDARAMGIAGEDLPGSHSATEFVAWYNGHPDYVDRDFDLSAERAVVIGNGNVAIDIARLLLSTPVRLARSDIAQHALEQLSTSRIREVVVVGRRGPAEAAFTNGELLGLLNVPELDVVVDPEGFGATDHPDRALDFAAVQKAARLSELVGRKPTNDRRVVFRFCASPERLLGQHQVRGIRLVHNTLVADGSGVRAVPTDEFDELDCGLVIRSVGYRGNPLGSVPFDSARATILNRNGRVIDPQSGRPVTGTYVTGWIKRGPSGVIGTNKQCAKQTVACLVEDFVAHGLAEPTTELSDMATRLPAAFDVRAWQAIDQHERNEGKRTGRPRVKLVDGAALLAVARQAITEQHAVPDNIDAIASAPCPEPKRPNPDPRTASASAPAYAAWV
jgi:ferredoxin--NADP+ reductase